MTVTVALVLAFLWQHVYGLLLVLAVLYLWHRIDRLESRMHSQLSHLDWRIDQVLAELPDDDWADDGFDSEERHILNESWTHQQDGDRGS